MADFPPIARAPIAILGIVSLIAGVLSGLARLGWEVPSLAVNAVGVHGVCSERQGNKTGTRRHDSL